MKNWCSICRLYDSIDLVLINTIRCQESDKAMKDLFLTQRSPFLFLLNHFQFYSPCFLSQSNKSWSQAWHSMTFLGLSSEPNHSGPWGLGLINLHCMFGMSKENEFCLTESKNMRQKKKKEPHWRGLSTIFSISLALSFFKGVVRDVAQWQKFRVCPGIWATLQCEHVCSNRGFPCIYCQYFQHHLSPHCKGEA